jgi:putative transposase
MKERSFQMSQIKTPQDVATERFEAISPLLDSNLDSSLFCTKKTELAKRYQVSYRTIGRWYQKYCQDGFQGLVPKAPIHEKSSSKLPANFAEIVEQAIELRRECPTRSVKTILKILELEHSVEPGEVSRSTLQRHLQKQGFGTKQVAMYQKGKPAARRFQKQFRGALYQGDIKYGPYLPIGPKGRLQQTFLAAWIDDATRFVVSAKFYANQTTDIIEDSLRTAIMQAGQPKALFVDNGKQYRSKWLKHACAKLGIRLLHAKEYSPESKGKIERVNRTVDSFLAECALQKPRTLDELNQYFAQEEYHQEPHTGLGGMSPATANRVFILLPGCRKNIIKSRIRVLPGCRKNIIKSRIRVLAVCHRLLPGARIRIPSTSHRSRPCGKPFCTRKYGRWTRPAASTSTARNTKSV